VFEDLKKTLCGNFKEFSLQFRYIVPTARVPSSLRTEHVAILIALWEDIHQGKKRGLDRRHLKTLLVKEQDADGQAPVETGARRNRVFASEATLFAQLSNLKLITNLVETNDGYSGGKPFDVYTISQEHAVTWPTTARILTDIHDATDQSIEEEALVKLVRSKGVRRSAESAIITETTIKSALAWVSDAKRMPPYVERLEEMLLATPRLRFEIDYLRVIAEYAPLIPEQT
jgi:hypothetical protein